VENLKCISAKTATLFSLFVEAQAEKAKILTKDFVKSKPRRRNWWKKSHLTKKPSRNYVITAGDVPCALKKLVILCDGAYHSEYLELEKVKGCVIVLICSTFRICNKK